MNLLRIKPIAPVTYLYITGILFLICVYFSLDILTHQPWLGIDFEARSGNVQQLVVEKVYSGSPADNKILPGTVVTGISSGSSKVVFSEAIKIEPLSLRNYDEYTQALNEQGKIFDLLSQNQVSLLTEEGSVIPIQPSNSRPLRSIPAYFWGLLLANLIGLLIGVFVWTFKPNTLESGFLLVAGASYFLFGLIFSVIISRELALPADLLHSLAAIQSFFINVFSWALFSIFSYYPIRLLPLRVVYLTVAIVLLLSVNYAFRIVEIPLHIFFLQFIPMYIGGIWLGYRQWVVSYDAPVNRAAILLLILSILIPVGLIILFYFIPVIIQQPPLLGVISTRLVLLILFSGFALGILRYRLFDVEHWWIKSWLWLLGGTTVAVVDMVFVTFFSLNHTSALALSVVITGFLYFPIRQWLIARILDPKEKPLDSFIPTFSKLISSSESREEFERRWGLALKERFDPINCQKNEGLCSAPYISENGLDLYCPGITPEIHYRLTGKQGGTRLFDRDDLSATASLQSMAKLASDTGNAREDAVRAERSRIMTDLHDSLGADLITLLHIAESDQAKKHAQRALQTLRDAVKISVNDEPGYLVNYLAQWRSEVVQRTELANVTLDWQSKGVTPDIVFPTDFAIKLTNILRESINNALKHAQPSMIKVEFNLQEGRLDLDVCNNGQTGDCSRWESGVGLANMQSKVQSLNGKFVIQQSEEEVCLKVSLPHIVSSEYKP